MITALSRVGSQYKLTHEAARSDLLRYKPPCIKTAPDAIARLHGYKNFSRLERRHLQAQRELASPTDLMDTDNYKRKPIEFALIDTVVRSRFPRIRRIYGLQLAANYGPYLHYLRNTRGFMHIEGIDIDPIAVRYAQSIGVPITEADARHIPREDQSLDVVFSYHFLDPNYLKYLLHPTERDDYNQQMAIIDAILKEVHRVLQPGGVFITHLELPATAPQLIACAWGRYRHLKIMGLSVYEKA